MKDAPLRGFLSYAREDSSLAAAFRAAIAQHLASAADVDVEIWDDTQIGVGEKWKGAIEAQIVNCDFIILFVSSAFTNSKFIREVELPSIMNVHEQRNIPILPIRARPCRLESLPELREFQFFASGPNSAQKYHVNNETFSYADLCTFDTDMQVIPNSNRDRYDLDFCNMLLEVLKTSKPSRAPSSAPRGIPEWLNVGDLENEELFLRSIIRADARLAEILDDMEDVFFRRYCPRLAKDYTVEQLAAHFINIEVYIYRLCEYDLRLSLSPTEAFILLAGIYFHDIGVVLCHEDSEKYPRDEHHVIGRDYWLKIHGDFSVPRDVALAISFLIHSHRKIDMTTIAAEFAVGKSTIRLQLLCSLLRLADFLDYEHGAISGTAQNIREIIEHSEVSGVIINRTRWQIKLSGSAFDGKTALFMLNLQANLEATLRSVRPVLREYGMEYEHIDVDEEVRHALFSDQDLMRFIRSGGGSNAD